MIFYSYLITRKSFSWVKSANKSPKTVRLTYTSETENDHLNFVIVCLEFHQIFKGVAGCYCLNSIFFFWLPNFAIAESFVNARHFSEKSLDNQPNIQPAIRRSRRPLNHQSSTSEVWAKPKCHLHLFAKNVCCADRLYEEVSNVILPSLKQKLVVNGHRTPFIIQSLVLSRASLQSYFNLKSKNVTRVV